MARIYHISSIIIVFAFVQSCQKTVYNHSAKGRVVDATTGQPISMALVELYRTRKSTNIKADGDSVASLLTVADGFFNFSYRKVRNKNLEFDYYNYKIYASATGYFFDSRLDYIIVDGSDGSNRDGLKIGLIPMANLIFDIRSTKNGMSVEFESESKRNGFGKTVNKGVSMIYPCSVEGNSNTNIRYAITLNSGNVIYYDTSVYCPAFKTTNFIIEF